MISIYQVYPIDSIISGLLQIKSAAWVIAKGYIGFLPNFFNRYTFLPGFSLAIPKKPVTDIIATRCLEAKNDRRPAPPRYD